MAQRRILLIDDEPEIRDVVRYALEKEGYVVDAASTFDAAREKARSGKHDAILLDLMLPGGNGLDILRELRRAKSIPTIILSSLDEDADVVAGLELGADDYLKKPFSPRELVARLRALFRRADNGSPATRTFERGSLRIDQDRHEVFWNGNAVVLTVSEFSILAHLMEAPDRVHSREALLRAIHGFDPISSDRVVDVHIKEVRRKLRRIDPEASPIETVTGVGYRIR